MMTGRVTSASIARSPIRMKKTGSCRCSSTVRSSARILSPWLEEMGIENTANLRKTVKNYRSFFKTKAHRTKVANLNQKVTAPVQLYKAVIAVLCGVKDTGPNLLIRTVLRAGTDQGKTYLPVTGEIRCGYCLLADGGSGHWLSSRKLRILADSPATS